MCGRYQFAAEQCDEIHRIAQMIDKKYGAGQWQSGEIRPSAKAPVLLRHRTGEISPELMRWGYQLPGTLVINARAETAAEKQLFRESVYTRRCLVPSTGFYEWDAAKRKYLFTLPDSDVLYMAGLYKRHGGEDCYCILTTASNDSMRSVHDRMPVILTGEQTHTWLADGPGAAYFLSAQSPQLGRQSLDMQTSLW